MRQTCISSLKTISIFCSPFLFLFASQVYASGAKSPDVGADTQVSAAYTHVDPENLVPQELLVKTLNYFETNKSKIKNQDYIVVIDYKQHSSKERFYLIDTQSGVVETYLVAHGKGSDPNSSGNASKFSDVEGSLMSSLGYFLTGETYEGSNGFSLKLDGLSSTNLNARSRAIVIHGAEYVTPGSVGRSWGCPALDMRYYEEVIDKIKGGALVYSE